MNRRGTRGGLVICLLILLFGAVLTYGAVSKYQDQRSGTAGKARVGDCSGHVGRYSGGGIHCNGTWIIGGSLLDGGHVVYGRIEGVSKGDVGKTVDVRIHGEDHATKPSLGTPIMLLALGLLLMGFGGFLLFRLVKPRGAPGVAAATFLLALVALAPASASATTCVYPSDYPGDNAAKEKIAAWMAGGAVAAGLPGELPVMASLTDTGLQNLNYGDADSVGYFQMRKSIWDSGDYAGFPDHPTIQLQWFIDQAIKVRQNRIAQGLGDPTGDENKWGEWVADVQRPAAQYRGRYQLRLQDSRSLIAAGCAAPDSESPSPSPVPAPDGQPGAPDAQLIPDSVLPALKVSARRFQPGGALVARAACANENCLLRAAAKIAVPKLGVFKLPSIQPRSVKRKKTTTFRLVLGKRLTKLVAASVRRGRCPLAAIRVVAANAGGYRLSASRTVTLAPNARACK